MLLGPVRRVTPTAGVFQSDENPKRIFETLTTSVLIRSDIHNQPLSSLFTSLLPLLSSLHSIWSSLSCSILPSAPHYRTIGDRISTRHVHRAPVLTSVALVMARLMSHSSCVITIVMRKSSDLLCVVVLRIIISKPPLTSSSRFQRPRL